MVTLLRAARKLRQPARLLLDAGADPNLANSGFTPLMIAAATGQPEVLRLLLARGAALDAVDPRSKH
jgi:ankyrin repeat protein